MPTVNPQPHHRRSIRLPGYDYARPGAYFVTLVAWQRECLFGEILSGEMVLNDFGILVANEWRRLEKRFGNVVVGDFIVMPNHLHGILHITESDPIVGAGQETTLSNGHNFLAPPLLAPPQRESPPHDLRQTNNPSPANARPMPAPLGTIVGSFKSTTARLTNGLRRTPTTPVWQRNYYEHIIRDENELRRIRLYIAANPSNWQNDEENR